MSAHSGQRPKLAIITGSYGNGHNAAARALQDGFATWHPDIPIVVINNRLVVGPIVDTCAGIWYRLSTSGDGGSYRSYCSLVESQKMLRRHLKFANLLWARGYRRQIRRHDVGFAAMTYPTTAYALEGMPEILGYDVVVTDLTCLHPYWKSGDRCHRFIVSIQETARELVAFGVSPEQIDLMGYPLRLAFMNPPTREAARRELKLPLEGKMAIFLPGSGAGMHPEEVVRALNDCPGVTVLAMCGSDKTMRKRLAKIGRRTIAYGFVQDFEKYLAAADVAVGKAGPGFLVEAATIGVPVAITGYIMPQERGNVDVATSRGWGKMMNDVDELRAFVNAAPLRLSGQGNPALAATRKIVDRLAADYLKACG